jgi:shikimate dehydrogenase
MRGDLSGKTRLFPIVGDPIAQVKSPSGVTEAFIARGVDAICIPMHIAPEDFQTFIAAMRRTQNAGGIIVTVPHKFAAFKACDTVNPRAKFLETVNTIRRQPNGRLHGDMFDGLGLVAACQQNGCTFKDHRALVIGAGGAGTAIAHAIASAGVAEMGIYDTDQERRDTLIKRLQSAGFNAGPARPSAAGYDIVVNATPLGMRAQDPLPLDIDSIEPRMFVGDVVTLPELPPLIVAARQRGCKTSTGTEMFLKVRDHMVDFLLADTSETNSRS